MSVMPMLKLSSLQLSDSSSDVVPGMSRVALVPSKARVNSPSLDIKKKELYYSSLDQANQSTVVPNLLVGTLIGGGIAAFSAGRKPIIQHTGNIPAGLIGAGLGVSALLGYTGYQVVKYGGFFDKQRDFYNMFKNL
jgi:hypothetical protein